MKNSTHKGMKFLGIGNGEEVTNAPFPMPQATGRLSLSTHKGMEFPVAFNKITRLDEENFTLVDFHPAIQYKI